MIPTIDNYTEWFTCAARFYFLREGYAFLSFALDQVVEPGFPADQLLAADNTLVGLQFARPVEAHPTPTALEYEADAAHHELMSKAEGGWLLFALPQFADVLDQQLTHQKMLFAEADGVDLTSARRLAPRETMTFKQLVACIEDGSCGRDLPQDFAPDEFVATTKENPATMYLVINRRERVVFVLKGRTEGHPNPPRA